VNGELTIKGEIESLHIEDGALLVLSCAPDYQIAPEQVHGFAQQIEEWFADHGVRDVRVLVLAGLTLRKAT